MHQNTWARLCLLGILLLSYLPIAQAASIALQHAVSGQELNGQLWLSEDRSRSWTLAQAREQPFQPADGKTSVGGSPSHWWLRIDIDPRGQTHDWLLVVGAVTLHDLVFYLPDANGVYQPRPSGQTVAFAQGRDLNYRRPVVYLPQLNEPYSIYLRSYDPAGNSFPLKLWQSQDLENLRADENIGLGLIYGTILALLLYNLFVLISLRDWAYFWYVMATGSALIFIMSMSGHGFQYLWPNAPVPWYFDRVVVPSIWGLCASAFTQALLQTRRHVRLAHHVLTFGIVVYVLAIAIDGLGYRWLAAAMIGFLILTSIPAALIAAFIRWRQGFYPGLLYLIGYGFVLSSMVVLILRALGIVQPNDNTAYIFPLSVAFETILFSFALAYRIQLLKQEKSHALELANQEKSARLQLFAETQERLERAVAERTAELETANQRLRDSEEELKAVAFLDPLTQLPNRRYLLARADEAFAHAQRHLEPLAMLVIDLDNFKPINDEHGHDAGDMVLSTIAERMRRSVRHEDTLARLGGDEFAVLLSGDDAPQQAEELANRLLGTLANVMHYDNEELRVTPSIGLAWYPQHASNFDHLYRAADKALYRVKQQGRAGLAIAEQSSIQRPAVSYVDTLQAPKGLRD